MAKIGIIGAGPGGLATAMLLAARGHEVCIHERLPHVGGRTSVFEMDGYRFDLGPTFFLYPRILDEIFEECGFRLRDEVEMHRLDPQYRIQFGNGGCIDATPDIDEMERQIGAISPQDAPGFRRFMEENRHKMASFEPILQSPFNRWQDMLSLYVLSLLPTLRPHQSLERYLHRFFKDPRIRLAFSFQSKYLGMSPYRCPSLFSILSFLEYEYGVWHPIGGCGAVSRRMAELASGMGARIRLNDPVTAIQFEGRRAVGLETSDGPQRYDAIVVNADFARAMTRLVPDRLRRRWTNRRLEKKKYSCSTFMLYLGIEGRYELPHHTIHISADYARNLGDIEDRHILGADPSFYVQNASVTDPTLAPACNSTLYVLAPVTHQHPNIDWDREKEPFRKLILQQLAKAGYEDVERRIVTERVVTPAEWDQSYEIHRGATFNLAHNLGQMLNFRPHNRFEDIDGIYLVGGGTHPGSGLPVIYESARITTNLLDGDLAGLPRRRPVKALVTHADKAVSAPKIPA